MKQRHTSKRIFERLRDEHGYFGGLTIVKDYVLSQRSDSDSVRCSFHCGMIPGTRRWTSAKRWR